MNKELLKRIEKLEERVQYLEDKIEDDSIVWEAFDYDKAFNRQRVVETKINIEE